MKPLRMLVLVTFFPLITEASAITNGSITVTGVFPFMTFDFSGSDFSVAGGGSPGNWQLASVFSPGATVGVGGNIFSTDFEPGNATVGGTNLSVFWGALNAEGPSNFIITGPPITLSAGPLTYQSTFTFNGALCGTQSNGNAHGDACVVDLPSLTGSGVVTADFHLLNGLLAFTSATYTFVIPEPGTSMLAGAGIVIVTAALRRLSRIPSLF
jgi:hypothetical protein